MSFVTSVWLQSICWFYSTFLRQSFSTFYASFFRMSLIIWKWSETFLAINPAQPNTFRTLLCASGELADNLGYSSVLIQGQSEGVHSFVPFPFLPMKIWCLATGKNVFVKWPYNTFQVKCCFNILGIFACLCLFPAHGKRVMLSERHFVAFSYFIKYWLGKERKIVRIFFACSFRMSGKYSVSDMK